MGLVSRIGRAIDPTTSRGRANILTGGMYEANDQLTGGALGRSTGVTPMTPGGGQSAPSQGPRPLMPPPQGGYQPQFSRAPPGGMGAPPGYGANPFQQARGQQAQQQSSAALQQAQAVARALRNRMPW